MHVLIVEGFRQGHEMLKKMGFEITLIIENHRISGNEEGFYDRYFIVSDNASLEEWLEVVKKINNISHIDSIVNFHEDRQYETAKIAEYLKIDYYNDIETKVCKDKIYMRSFLNENKIDFIKNGLVTDVYNALNNNDVRFPIIIKPNSGWASKHIYKVDTKNELENVLQVIKHDNEYDVYCYEEFITGEEYSVESFSNDNNHKIITITKKYKDSNFVEIGHSVPANLGPKEYDAIRNKVLSLLICLKHKNGPMHTEIILNSNNEVHIVETHLRMGGDNIPDLVKYYCGFDLLNNWCKQITNQRINWLDVPELKSINDNSNICIRFFAPKDDLIGKKIKQINEEVLTNDNRIIEYKVFVKENDIIRKNIDSFTRLGYIIYQKSNIENIDKYCDSLIESLLEF